MMNVLSLAKRLIQTDRGSISLIRLNENDISAALAGNTLEFPHEARRNTFTAMRRGNCEIIDVDLFSLLLEFLQLISNQPANDRIASKRNEHNEVLFAKKVPQVSLTWHGVLISIRLSKCLAEDREQIFKKRYIRVSEGSVCVRHHCLLRLKFQARIGRDQIG